MTLPFSSGTLYIKASVNPALQSGGLIIYVPVVCSFHKAWATKKVDPPKSRQKKFDPLKVKNIKLFKSLCSIVLYIFKWF